MTGSSLYSTGQTPGSRSQSILDLVTVKHLESGHSTAGSEKAPVLPCLPSAQSLSLTVSPPVPWHISPPLTHTRAVVTPQQPSAIGCRSPLTPQSGAAHSPCVKWGGSWTPPRSLNHGVPAFATLVLQVWCKLCSSGAWARCAEYAQGRRMLIPDRRHGGPTAGEEPDLSPGLGRWFGRERTCLTSVNSHMDAECVWWPAGRQRCEPWASWPARLTRFK